MKKFLTNLYIKILYRLDSKRYGRSMMIVKNEFIINHLSNRLPSIKNYNLEVEVNSYDPIKDNYTILVGIVNPNTKETKYVSNTDEYWDVTLGGLLEKCRLVGETLPTVPEGV